MTIHSLDYSFPNLEPVHCFMLVLTVASWPAYRFLRRQVKCSGIPISLRIFHNLLWSTVKGFRVVNEENVFCFLFFLEFPCFFYDPTKVGNLFSGSSAFSKSNLYIWKFLVHILMKLILEDFEYYFDSIWNQRRQWPPLQYSCLENPTMEEPGRLQSMGSLKVGHNWATSLSLFTFMHWR